MILPESMSRFLPLVFLLFSCTAVQAQELKSLLSDAISKTQFGVFTDSRMEVDTKTLDAEWYSGQLVGHITSRLSSRLLYFAEMTFTPDVGHGRQVKLERSLFRFYFRDEIGIQIGRIHTPVTLWNVTYHHGRYLQTSITRPEIVKYSTNFSPIHSIVAELNGTFDWKVGSFKYVVGTGDRGDPHPDQSDNRYSAKNPSIYFGFSLKPSRILGLTIGGTVYRESIDWADPETDDNHSRFTEVILAGHLAYDSYRWNLISEVMNVTHENERKYGGSYGYYTQLARRLGGVGGRITLYGRYGRLSKNPDDPLFLMDRCLNWRGVTAGVRIDIAPTVAFTAEYRQYGGRSLAENRPVGFQLSAAF